MTTAAARPAKTTFVAVSPITGTAHTRKSARAYTHAVVCFKSAESVAEGLRREAAFTAKRGRQYHIIADLLELNAEPSRTEPLQAFLFEATESSSFNSRQAGVRTRWQDVLYHIAGEPTPNGIENRSFTLYASRAEAATSYRTYAERELNRAFELTATATQAKPDEAASFHHSAALAAKEVLKNNSTGSYWTEVAVVEVTTGPVPAKAKAAWSTK